MEVFIYRSRRYSSTYLFCLRQMDNKKFVEFNWYRTMAECRKRAEEKGYTLIERPDLIKKWSKRGNIRYK